MLEVIGAGNPEYSGPDWADIWADSPEHQARSDEIKRIVESPPAEKSKEWSRSDREFAMPLWTQVVATTRRSFIAYWRTPDYALVGYSVKNTLNYGILTTIFVKKRGNSCFKYGQASLIRSHFGIFVIARLTCSLDYSRFLWF